MTAPSLDEQLSRYLEDDLSAEAQSALEVRLQTEPEVAAALEDLRTMRAALRELPTTAVPPPLTRVPRGSRRLHVLVPWIAAAAALVLWLIRPVPDPAEVTLREGLSELEGDLRIAAGEVSIVLDGRARIRVEPPGTGLRPADRQEDPMDTRTPLAALAGAAVTLVVLEGTALVTSPDQPGPVRVEAGRPHTFGEPAAATVSPADRTAALQAEVDALREQLEATERELSLSTMGSTLARGQLALLQGTESRWPDDVPESMTPERFEEELTKRVALLEGVSVDRVDCDEFPCLAALRLEGDVELPDWRTDDHPLKDWVFSELGGRHSLSVNTSHFQHDEHSARYVLFGAYGEDRGSEVGVRTKYRIDTLVQSLGEEVAAEAERQ